MANYRNVDGRDLSFTWNQATWTETSAAGQTLTGDGRDNALFGRSGTATLVGGLGNDSYYVVDIKDRLVERAGEGYDQATSWTGKYVLPDNVEALTAGGANAIGLGNRGDNLIRGGAGSQSLGGLGGHDVLEGGAGADTFLVARGNGSDAIVDFRPGEDVVRLDGYTGLDFAALRSRMVQSGTDTVLSFDNGERLVLRDVAASQLSARDFVLPSDPSAGLKQTFADEFNGFKGTPYAGGADWRTTYFYGDRTLGGNSENQYYSDSSVGVNPFSVQDGVLTITAAPAAGGKVNGNGQLTHTSGMISSQNILNQQYGYFEMRAELPAGQGLWPAFWMLPSRGGWPPEIDIMEQLGHDPTTIYNSVHIGEGYRQDYTTLSAAVSDTSQGFHTYGLMWTAEKLTWYYDGAVLNELATPTGFHQPMYVIANLAVGGGWPGRVDASTPFPATMEIDYIRAYSLEKAAATPASSAPSTPIVTAPGPAPEQVPTPTPAPAPVPTPAPVPAPVPDTLVLRLSEDAWKGDAQFTVHVGGKQVGGTHTVTASRAKGEGQDFTFTGDFGDNPFDVKVTFVNDAWGGTAATDRNLYLEGATLNGVAQAGAKAAIMSGAKTIRLDAPTAPTTAPRPDTLVLRLSEDAWKGDAQFTVHVGGKQVGGTHTVTASRAKGEGQDFTFTGDFGDNPFDVKVTFVNDAWGGTAATDRNLYLEGATLNGVAQAGAKAAIMSGAKTIRLDAPTAPTTAPRPDKLVLHLSEDAYQGDAQFTLRVDGKVLAEYRAVTASHARGESQAFVFEGDLGDRPLDVKITFTNDAWGGNKTLDRNLYLDKVELNGRVQAVAPIEFEQTGTQGFTLANDHVW